MKSTSHSKGHAFLVCDDGLFQLIESANCKETASLDVFPRRVAWEASIRHCVILVNTLPFLVVDFPSDLWRNSHVNNEG